MRDFALPRAANAHADTEGFCGHAGPSLEDLLYREIISEPGTPVPASPVIQKRSPELYRHSDCARAAACAGVASKQDWPAWGCAGCPHDTEDCLEPPPPTDAHRAAVRRGVHKPAQVKPMRRCAVCGEPTRNLRTCSKACSATYAVRLRGRGQGVPVEAAAEAYTRGLTLVEVAACVGVQRERVRTALVDSGLRFRRPGQQTRMTSGEKRAAREALLAAVAEVRRREEAA